MKNIKPVLIIGLLSAALFLWTSTPYSAGATVQDEPSIEVGIESIADNVVMVQGYEQGKWTAYRLSSSHNSLEEFEVGRGYLIHVSSACVLEYGNRTYQLDKGKNLIGWLDQRVEASEPAQQEEPTEPPAEEPTPEEPTQEPSSEPNPQLTYQLLHNPTHPPPFITVDQFEVHATSDILDAWLSAYDVPERYYDYWREHIEVISDNRFVPEGFHGVLCTWVGDMCYITFTDPEVNCSIYQFSHEMGHASLLMVCTEEQKAEWYDEVYPSLRADQDWRSWFKFNGYARKNATECHAEIYRRFGIHIPSDLREYFPKLID